MRRVPEDPGTVLFGKTRRRVLGLLFGRPDESFYVRDIVRRSGAAQGAIARELAALLGAGLLWRDDRGRQVYYQANKHAPIFPSSSGWSARRSWWAISCATPSLRWATASSWPASSGQPRRATGGRAARSTFS